MNATYLQPHDLAHLVSHIVLLIFDHTPAGAGVDLVDDSQVPK